jgi:hypothetical protein
VSPSLAPTPEANPFNIVLRPIPADEPITCDGLTVNVTPSPSQPGRYNVQVEPDAECETFTYPGDRVALHVTDPDTGRGVALAVDPDGSLSGYFIIDAAISLDDLEDARGVPSEWAAARP